MSVSNIMLRNLGRGFNRLSVRSAGGGGRPGRRPAFNWKEKKILGLEKSSDLKPFKLREDGFLEDLMPYFNAARGDKIIGADQLKDGFSIEGSTEELLNENNNKQVSVALLFGSKKSAGMLPNNKASTRVKIGDSLGLALGSHVGTDAPLVLAHNEVRCKNTVNQVK